MDLKTSYYSQNMEDYSRTWRESFLLFTGQEGEFFVICEFAENYAFVVQDAAPGFHWNNNQATIYTVVVYYKENDIIVHKSLAIISDCLHHDAVAVHIYTKMVVNFIKTIDKNVTKVWYFSDGAPSQYKNIKKFVNIYYHKEDFGIDAEWHFSATAHDKGPCDGVGGAIRAAAARASLQLSPDRQITTPQELHAWTAINMPSVQAEFSSKEEYVRATADLKERFDAGRPITGTQKFHCIIPQANGIVNFKYFSRSEYFILFRSLN